MSPAPDRWHWRARCYVSELLPPAVPQASKWVRPIRPAPPLRRRPPDRRLHPRQRQDLFDPAVPLHDHRRIISTWCGYGWRTTLGAASSAARRRLTSRPWPTSAAPTRTTPWWDFRRYPTT